MFRGGQEQTSEPMENVKPVVQEKEESTSEMIGGYLTWGGDILKKGMVEGAKLVSKGIIAAGEFWETKITKKEVKKIEPDTMMKVKAANTTSLVVLNFTKA